jgi:hypothetical protein
MTEITASEPHISHVRLFEEYAAQINSGKAFTLQTTGFAIAGIEDAGFGFGIDGEAGKGPCAYDQAHQSSHP